MRKFGKTVGEVDEDERALREGPESEMEWRESGIGLDVDDDEKRWWMSRRCESDTKRVASEG